MSLSTRARRIVGLFATLMVVAALFVAPVTAAEPKLYGQFMGEAWGNRANAKAGEVSVRLGRAAYQPCPCRGTNGNVRSNMVNDVDAGDIYRAGKLVSTAQAEKQAGLKAFGQTTSKVLNVSALDGLIRADAISAVATVRATTTSIDVSAAGSAITNLRIAGQSVTVDPGERIDLPGFGYISFFDVQRSGDGTTRRSIQVEMLRIVITRANALDLPIGSVIVVAHARVGYVRQESASLVGAAAWGSEATSNAGSIVSRFGRSAPAYLGCFANGTSSGSNRVESVTYPQLFHSATIVSQVYGSISSTATVGRGTSRLETVNLLNGLVTADVIKGVATATVNGSGGKTTFEGSKFVDLRVLGVAIGDNVAPNTQVAIPGVGTLTLFATSASSDGDDARASVYMLVLQVSLANSLGLPVGTTIKLAHAEASANRP